MFFIFVGIVFFVFIFFKIKDLKKNPLKEKSKKVRATIILVTLFIFACMFVLAGIGSIASDRGPSLDDKSLNGRLNYYATINATHPTEIMNQKMSDVRVEIFDYSVQVKLLVKDPYDEDTFIRDSSMYALKAAKDIYENCPEVNRIYFEFDMKFMDKYGKESVSKAFGFYYEREMEEKVNYDNFKNMVLVDYNKMWNVINTTYIDPVVTRGLKKFSKQQFMIAQEANSHENRVKEFVENKIDESWETDFSPEHLQWSKRSAKAMDWNDAVNYCKTLNEGNHNDWKLPTIGELRTLIKNCPKTELNGVCKIGKKNCLSLDCFEKLSGYCSCEYKDKNSGYYSKLKDGSDIWLWSSSSLSESQYSKYRWYVNFDDGGVGEYKADADNLYVRCVRVEANKVLPQKRTAKDMAESSTKQDTKIINDNSKNNNGSEKKIVAKVSIGKTEVDGAIDSTGVDKVIKSIKPAIQRCYDKALLANPTLQGKVSLAISINEKGHVENIKTTEDTLNDDGINKCFLGILNRLRFSKPNDGKANIVFQILFAN